MQSYIPHWRGTVFNLIIIFPLLSVPCFIDLLRKTSKKYNIFFNVRFTENMIFALGVFTQMLYFMQWVIKSYNEQIKTISKKINYEKVTCKMQNCCILLTFLLITIALFIAVNIYWYLMKYRAKQKHLLPFHDTKLKEIHINNMN